MKKVLIYLGQTADGDLCGMDASDSIVARAADYTELRLRLDRAIKSVHGDEARATLLVGRPARAA